MRKIQNLIALAICFAALLTSCIKEESYKLETAYVDVSISTRGATNSQHQGDGITDAMVWAFKCSAPDANGIPQKIDSKASGWRTVTGLNTYQSVNLHVQLPLCDVGKEPQNYVLVTIINRGQFGRIYDRTQQPTTDEYGNNVYPTLELNSETTWEKLQNAAFDASGTEYWDAYIYGDNTTTTKTPNYMPVSHWKCFSVDNENTHSEKCAKVNMDVYRALAKCQLFMKKARPGFTLNVVETKLTNYEFPTEGIVLSKLTDTALQEEASEQQPVPAWFGSDPAHIEKNSGSVNIRSLKNSEGIIDGKTNIAPVTATSDYQFVGSTVMYEAKGVCEQKNDTYNEGSVSEEGYFLELTYTIGEGESLTRCTKYVAIPYAVVRNHDYQIKATVFADGQLSVQYEVADWTEKTWNLTYDAPTNTNLLPTPRATNPPASAPAMRYTGGTEDGAFVGYFQMSAPEGLTWTPTHRSLGSRFEIKVYQVSVDESSGNVVNSILATPPIQASASTWYQIKVIPLQPMDPTVEAYNVVELGITYAPKWDESATDYLIINAKQSNDVYYWGAKSGNEFLLKITQNDNLNN